MTTPNKIGQALIHLHDAFNSNDADSVFELNLVEQHIEELETQVKDRLEIGMYLHYFATEVIKQLPECTGDLFGIGEDALVLDLYPFAELIVNVSNKAYEDGKHFTGVFVYDAMEELVGLFIATIMRQQPEGDNTMAYEMPELDEYELDVVRVVDSHTA